MKLFVIRHGQTSYNIGNRVCGSTDAPLNAEGIRQAELAAQRLLGTHIDAIYSSPLRRALNTAQIIAPSVNIDKASIIVDSRLAEQDYGLYEGVDAATPGFQKLRVQFACSMPQGESAIRAAARAYSFLDEICGKASGKSILLATHGSICRAINSYFYNMTNDEYFKFIPNNCEILEYEV